jgi:hypothetical protein
MTTESFEQQWAAIAARRARNLAKLVQAGAVDQLDVSALHRSDDHVVVGTIIESTEPQRDGLLFSSPTSRRHLLRSLRS